MYHKKIVFFCVLISIVVQASQAPQSSSQTSSTPTSSTAQMRDADQKTRAALGSTSSATTSTATMSIPSQSESKKEKEPKVGWAQLPSASNIHSTIYSFLPKETRRIADIHVTEVNSDKIYDGIKKGFVSYIPGGHKGMIFSYNKNEIALYDIREDGWYYALDLQGVEHVVGRDRALKQNAFFKNKDGTLKFCISDVVFGSFAIYDVQTGVRDFLAADFVKDFVICKDDENKIKLVYMTTGALDKKIKIYDIENKYRMSREIVPDHLAHMLAITQANQLAYLATKDQKRVLIPINTSQKYFMIAKVQALDEDENELYYENGNEYLASINGDNFDLWNLATGLRIANKDIEVGATGNLQIVPMKNFIAITENGSLYIFDKKELTLTQVELEYLVDYIEALTDKTLIVRCSNGMKSIIYNNTDKVEVIEGLYIPNSYQASTRTFLTFIEKTFIQWFLHSRTTSEEKTLRLLLENKRSENWKKLFGALVELSKGSKDRTSSNFKVFDKKVANIILESRRMGPEEWHKILTTFIAAIRNVPFEEYKKLMDTANQLFNGMLQLQTLYTSHLFSKNQPINVGSAVINPFLLLKELIQKHASSDALKKALKSFLTNVADLALGLCDLSLEEYAKQKLMSANDLKVQKELRDKLLPDISPELEKVLKQKEKSKKQLEESKKQAEALKKQQAEEEKKRKEELKTKKEEKKGKEEKHTGKRKQPTPDSDEDEDKVEPSAKRKKTESPTSSSTTQSQQSTSTSSSSSGRQATMDE